MKIFKFPIGRPNDEVIVEMQSGAEILCVKLQGHEVCIWAIVPPNAPLVPRKVQIRGTGHQMTNTEGKYIGTVMIAVQGLVLHLFISPEGV